MVISLNSSFALVDARNLDGPKQAEHKMIMILKRVFVRTSSAYKSLARRGTLSYARAVDHISSCLSIVERICRVPWSIHDVVRRDLADWRAFNLVYKEFSLSFWARGLMLAGEHPVWLCSSLPLLFVVLSAALYRVPCAWLPHGWSGWQASEQLSYFSTLWSVQATLAALAYPIVIAFVAVFLQRRPAADSFMHLYMLNSGALAAGLSSLMLVVAMAVQYVAMPYLGAQMLLQWGALDSIWFFLNAVLTTHFLYRTVEFLRPDVQSNIVARYVASVALPREIKRLYPYQVFANADARGWIPAVSYPGDKEKEGPRVLLTRFLFGRGEQQGILNLKSPSRLVNVRMWPLWLVIQGWEHSAQQWPRPTNASPGGRTKWPLLTVPMTPGIEYCGSIAIAQVEDGPDLSLLQRRLLRCAFMFRGLRREKYDIRVKAVLEEFELDARTAAEKADAKAFERAYNALLGLHGLLIGASLVKNEDGSVGSWAMMPDFEEFTGLAMYVNWNNAYRSVFLAAIESMTRDSSLIRRLCYIGGHLGRDAFRTSPVEIRESLFDVQMLLMYQLGDWWTQRADEEGLEHGPDSMATLSPPLLGIYEDVVLTFVGGWENSKTHVTDIPKADDSLEWSAMSSVARTYVAHAQGTAKLLLAAVQRGDRTAAEWFADSLNKWWGNLEYERQALFLHGKTDFLCVDDLSQAWESLASALGLGEQNGLRGHPKDLQRGVLLAVLYNFWTDIRLISIELLLSWACQADEDRDESLALEIAAGMLTGKQYRGGGTSSRSLNELSAADYLTAKVRQFASGGQYRAGYVARLSQFVERVKDQQQPRMVTSRAYSSFGADDLDSLQTQQLILMAVLSGSKWTVGTSLRRQLDVWMTQQYSSIEILRGRLTEWIQTASDETRLAPKMMSALLRRIGKTGEAAPAVSNLKFSLEALKATLESLRGEILQNSPVDPDRLVTLARYASLSAFERGTGAFPLQLFRNIDYTEDALEDFTLNMLQIRKGELTSIEMDQRAFNEADFWSETMKNQVGALAMSDVLRRCTIRDIPVRDSETYWSVLKSESVRMAVDGVSPILVLENQTRPEWVWQWQHADFGLGYSKPSDLRVWRADDKGPGYVCNFNEIEVYVANLPSGQSLLVSRNAFRTILFQRFAHNRFVDATYTTRIENPLLVDIHLLFSRRIEVGDSDVARLLYDVEGTGG
ncbi:hypothetical protein [Paraburkholderia azotifigens]|uniref:Uncharacterized protein n=1 Tax=Paraburkholderia azotifigens TaxID=2057004 RepID=A0ABU9RG78_9BURK